MGNSKTGTPWFFTPFGAFSLAFPGFVLGYYTIADGTLAQAVPIYSTIAAYSAGSLVLLGAIAAAARIPFNRGLPFLAATAAGIYYWFSAPVFGGAIGLGPMISDILRAVTLGFVLFWLVAAVRRSGARVPQPGAA